MILLLFLILVTAHTALTWALAIRRGLAARRRRGEPQLGDAPPLAASILVPAWNERGTIERCIHSLQQIEYPDWEALILAGGSDGTFDATVRATAGDARFRVLERGPGPKNIALMRGTEAARHDVLVLLDADGIVSPEWLRELVAPIARGAAVSTGERYPERNTWITLAEQMQNIQAYHILGTNSIQGDRSVAIRREVLARIGALPAHAYAREDWDLGIRLQMAGEQVAFAQRAGLLAQRPATLREFWQNEVRWRRTHLNGIWEHRAFFLKRPWMAIGQLYVYGLSVVLALAAIISIVLAVFWPPARPAAGGTAALAALWLGGRRASLGAEVAAYTGKSRWLGASWAPTVLLFVSFLASVVAILSVRRGTPFDYKGPRQQLNT